MGLSSAMTTALTGLRAAETKIDVAGNNLANAQTVGFKASDVLFATQFLQTLSAGSAPSETSGGTNPRQIGLGVQVAEITPNFSQGTLEISSTASDMAIQGQGLFIVQHGQSGTAFTRNGIFRTNSANELVSVTGNRLMGFGINELYELQTTQLVPLTIPLGSAAAAQATQNVFLNGNLTPTGDVASTAEVIQSGILGDGSVPRPEVNDPADPVSVSTAPRPDATLTGYSSAGSGSSFVAGDRYEYVFAFVDASGTETGASHVPLAATVAVNGNNLELTNLPPSPAHPLDPTQNEYEQLHIYRRKVGVPAGDPEADYRLVGTATEGAASFTDSSITPTTALNQTGLNGTYSYVVTFSGLGVPESRPSELLGPLSLVDGRVHLTNLPDLPPGYDSVSIYRSLAASPGRYYHVATLPTGTSPNLDYTDSRSDAEISDLAIVGNRELDMDGPKISASTLLTDVVRRNGLEYERPFQEGVIHYAGRKAGNALTEKSFEVASSTTVGEFLQFLAAASGIQSTAAGNPDTIPDSENHIPGESGTLTPGGVVTADGRMRLVSNNGTGNALAIPATGLQLELADGTTRTQNLGFASAQQAVGESASTTFLVYDSLGVPLNVRLTTVLEARDGNLTTYRWFADSGDNDPLGADHAIAVGTGLISFDGQGDLVEVSNATVNIDRQDIPSVQPLGFTLDFSAMSGFATPNSYVAAARQDGSAAGTLTRYTIGEDGIIQGVFTNGMNRTLGQVQLARFANPEGLEQIGQNMFATAYNSGLPVQAAPGAQGMGTIMSGTLELSNTDTGENLIDLIMASTQYRSNSRVISTSQELLDDLLNIRR
ncbi:MAG: flagellar hook-basal body complex protein [Planctomycetes bacterium]|nr:flagellar hook-basal body complex protein [Planctomycetota bacterium]